MTNEELMTAEELARQLKVRVGTIYSWAAAGTLPTFRVGRLLRFDRTRVQDWLAAQGNRPLDGAGSNAGRTP